MIVVDIETSGLNPIKHGIVEIVGIKFERPNRFYHSFCRLDKDDEIDPKALEINGQSVEEVRDIKRPSQKEALISFFKWIKKERDFYITGENVGGFDWNFIKVRSQKYDLDFPLQHRTLDLQTIAQTVYNRVYGKLLIENGKSKMGLPKILEFVGLKDKRKKVEDGKIVKEGKPHGALEDSKLEGEAESRLLYGKNLFPEFAEFKIPKYLK